MQEKKLNILYHHRTQGRGAEGVHIASIVKAFESMGHKVKVLSPPGVDPLSNAGNAPVDKSEVNTRGIDSVWKFISKKIPNFMFEFIEIFYNFPAMRQLEKELTKNNYDIIYERYAFYLIAGAIKSKKYGIPLVLEANEVNGIKDRARKQTFPWLCGVFERFLFNRTTSIHTVSSYLKNMIERQGVDTNKIHVSPNAIDPEKFSGNKDKADLVEKLSLRNQIVIGFAGWFDEWDRLDLLVDVFNNLRKKHENIKLLLIGDGEVLNVVRKKQSEYNLDNDIILTGAVLRKDVQRYLSLLDIAVFTHSNEFGSPVVMFEFMGLKIPIVAPALMPITDVLDDNKTALLFEVLNIDSLEEKLNILLKNSKLRDEISEKAYTTLMKKHTWLENAKEIIESSQS